MGEKHLQVSVEQGLHAGAVLEFSVGDVFSVGASLSNDIAVTDFLGDGEAFRVFVHKANKVWIYAVDGDVSVNSKELIRKADAKRFALPVSVNAEGGPEILLSSLALASQETNSPWWKRTDSSRLVRSATALCALLVLNLALGSMSIAHNDDGGVADITNRGEISDAGNSTVSSIIKTDEEDVQQVVDPTPLDPMPIAAMLQGYLGEIGLSGLSISVVENVVKVSGSIEADQMSQWSSVAPWFDAQVGSDYILLKRIEISETVQDLPKALSSIWLSDYPYIVDYEGRMVLLDAETSDGWRFVQLTDCCVLLQKGDIEYSVSLTD